MNNIDRISADGYVPNNRDILRSRLRTTGVHESMFDLGRWTYRMIDVGGQRSERKKWIHCFQNVNCLLFLVAISGYDHCLLDDRDCVSHARGVRVGREVEIARQTQMDEAFLLWESIVNSYWFTDSAIILFLDKMDLFVEKLLCKSIAKHGFPDYKGPADYQAASEHILDRFRALSHDPDKNIYCHFTNATDTDLFKITMESVQETIIQRSLNLLVLA